MGIYLKLMPVPNELIFLNKPLMFKTIIRVKMRRRWLTDICIEKEVISEGKILARTFLLCLRIRIGFLFIFLKTIDLTLSIMYQSIL